MLDTSIVTRKQREIYDFLAENQHRFKHPPSITELCKLMGLSSRGSMHKQVQSLVDAGLVEPLNGLHRGVTAIVDEADTNLSENDLPFMGTIAAGKPIEAIENPEPVSIPPMLRSDGDCFVLEIRGDSMIEEGIMDGDWVVIEQRNSAKNGEIVVALVDGHEATLKRLEQKPDEILLHPANSQMSTMKYHPDQVQIQGILVGQMRRYH